MSSPGPANDTETSPETPDETSETPDENPEPVNDESQIHEELFELPEPTESELIRKDAESDLDSFREELNDAERVNERNEHRTSLEEAIQPDLSEINWLFGDTGTQSILQNYSFYSSIRMTSDLATNPFFKKSMFPGTNYQSYLRILGQESTSIANALSWTERSNTRKLAFAGAGLAGMQMDYFTPLLSDQILPTSYIFDNLVNSHMQQTLDLIEPSLIRNIELFEDIMRSTEIYNGSNMGNIASIVAQSQLEHLNASLFWVDQIDYLSPIFEDILITHEPEVYVPAETIENQFFESLADYLAVRLPFHEEAQFYVSQIRLANDVIDKRKVFLNLCHGAKDGLLFMIYGFYRIWAPVSFYLHII